ncbi:MAG: creatininase family protein [Anaerolineae bacterium]
MAKLRLEEMLPHELEALLGSCPAVYLPLGTIEFHGPHMACGLDALKAEGICRRACARSGGTLAPTLFWGTGGGHTDYPATAMVRGRVLADLLDDALAGLCRIGFRVLVVLTGHYPQEQVDVVKGAATRLAADHREVRIWAGPEYEAYPAEHRGDHAARWETSFLMAVRPDLVEMDRLVGADAPDAPDATRSLAEMNAPGPLHGTLGQNPARYADAAQGEETVQAMAEFLADWVARAWQELKG